MLAYKVVRRIGGQLYSCTTGHDEPGRVLQYKPNTLMKPEIKGSYLYIFTSLQDAISFSDYYNREVWECEAKHLIKNPPYIHFGFNCLDFWKLRRNKKKYLHLRQPEYTNSTYGCKELTLIKQIKVYYDKYQNTNCKKYLYNL